MYGNGVPNSGVAGVVAAAPVATLPFTGFSVIWLVLAGMTLLTTGIAAVRLARR
jgi:uncharacterized membrane protein HdeD (DUF308 family)